VLSTGLNYSIFGIIIFSPSNSPRRKNAFSVVKILRGEFYREFYREKDATGTVIDG
jgi:hypothetical protein